MATEANKFRIGMFVFFGVVTAIALVFVYGAGRYLHETRQYVTYFAESVQGLEVNAPVKFRGLQIGRVEDIKLAPDGRLIEVIMRVDSGKFKARREHIVLLRGSSLTGIKYLEVELKNDQFSETLQLTFTSEYKVVPSVRSADVPGLIDSMKKQIDNLDAKTISEKLVKVLDELDLLIAQNNWQPVVSNLQHTASAVNRISSEIDTYVVGGLFSNVVTDASVAVKQLRLISEKLDPATLERVVKELTTLCVQLNQTVRTLDSNLEPTLQDLQRSAANLRSFTESLKNRPSQTMLGEPPAQEK